MDKLHGNCGRYRLLRRRARSPCREQRQGGTQRLAARRIAGRPALAVGEAEVIARHRPDIGAKPGDRGLDSRADEVAGRFYARRYRRGHDAAPERPRGGSSDARAPASSERPRGGSSDARDPASTVRAVTGCVATGWRASSLIILSAAFCPLRTAPSIVSGQPVSVHAPASTSPGTEVAAPGRIAPIPGTCRNVARRSLVTK